MTCGTRVVYRDAKRKGSGKPYRKVVCWYDSRFTDAMILAEHLPLLEVCNGKIRVTVEAMDEPDWGGSHAVLEINYRCETCGAMNFPHLPNSGDTLSDYLTRLLEQV